MHSHFKIGLFGFFEYTVKRREGKEFVYSDISTYGWITDMDDKWIWVADSADPNMPYMIKKSRVKQFNIISDEERLKMENRWLTKHPLLEPDKRKIPK